MQTIVSEMCSLFKNPFFQGRKHYGNNTQSGHLLLFLAVHKCTITASSSSIATNTLVDIFQALLLPIFGPYHQKRKFVKISRIFKTKYLICNEYHSEKLYIVFIRIYPIRIAYIFGLLHLHNDFNNARVLIEV